MTFALVVLASLASALAAAASGVLQHRSARSTLTTTAPPRRLLAHLLTRRLWLAGLLLGAVGLGLHAVALTGGQLALVQPLLVSGVLFALPVSALWERRRPSGRDALWALLLVAALASFLAVADPGQTHGSTAGQGLAMTTILGVALCVAAGTFGLRRPGRIGAAVLGVGAGLGYGLAAALLQRTATDAAHGLTAVISGWPVYALIAAGAAAIVLTQFAYRAGPLATSMPVITITDPTVSVLVGMVAFHQGLAHTPIALTMEIVSFVAMAVSATALSRRGQTDLPHPTSTYAASDRPVRAPIYARVSGSLRAARRTAPASS